MTRALFAPALALLRRAPVHARLDELCEFAPVDGAQEERVFWLVQLVRWIRPREEVRAPAKLRFLRAQLAQHPEWRARVVATLGALLAASDLTRALSYAGIPRHFHFGGAVREWVQDRALPAACRTTDAAQIMKLAFEERDRRWIGTPDAVSLLRELVPDALATALDDALREALSDLAHQVVAQAHAPAVRTLAGGERSPFRGLYDAVLALDAHPDDRAAHGALRGRVLQCERAIAGHRGELAERGADVNTTFQLGRLRQQLVRLRTLARLRHERSDEALGEVLEALVAEVSREAQGSRLVARSADLVVQNLVDSAANVGRGYLDEANSSWRAALRAGAGGGALMAVATVVKCWLAGLHLPPLYEGLAYSLNYGSAFVAAYLLHYTIATKLPAHTAAALARSVQGRGGHAARLRALVSVWRSTARLQLGGLIGNVLVVGPLAFAFDLLAHRAVGRHVLSAAKAEHVLRDTSLLGPSIVFAALTGLFLWVSSLIGAAADKWTRTVQLTDRLVTNPAMMSQVGPTRARAFADAVVSRAGGVLGNLSLGFLLGGVPAAFAIASLPVEIRHVTVSTGSVALALARGAGDARSIGLALAGLLAIAVVNVAVSFYLALWLALRATRGMRASGSWAALIRVGLRRWLRRDHRVAEAGPPPRVDRDAAAAAVRASSLPPRLSSADARSSLG